MTPRKKLFIISIGFCALVALIWMSTLLLRPASDKDIDTGTPLSFEGSQYAASPEDVFVFVYGLDVLLEKLPMKTGAYRDQLRVALDSFYQARVDTKKIKSLTVQPQSIKIDGSNARFTIRIGQSNDTLPVELHPTRTGGGLYLLVTDEQQRFGGNFLALGGLPYSDGVGSITYITAKNPTFTTPITLKLTALPGNRSALIDTISSFGYSPASFTYDYSEMEDPFL